MEQRQSLLKFRDWFFVLLIDYFVNSGWVIVVKDFKKSEKRNMRTFVGLTNYQEEIIYLDKDGGTPRILVHELCHFALGVILEKMAKNLPWEDLKKVKGKHRAGKEFNWAELRTQEFEEFFYNSLNRKQIKILRGFISEARARYEEDEG